MVYARVATGYRTGAPNSNPTSFVLPILKPDTTKNYELGLKGNFLNQKLSVDASVYHIDWKDIQLESFDTVTFAPITVGIFVNANAAKSQGLELSLEARPLEGLTVGLWGTWNQAVLTEDMPSNLLTVGQSGDRLPYAARFSGHLSIEQKFQLFGNLEAFAGGSVSYVGDRIDGFKLSTDPIPTRHTLPAYTRTDLRAGVKYDSWDIALYLNNVFDDRGTTSVYDLVNGPASGPGYTVAQIIQPRTIGLHITKNF
jgi:outer membrane receptor protein involved in Fe transport